MAEMDVQDKLRAKLDPYFLIRSSEGAWGEHDTGQRVQLDLWCRARPHLLRLGFTGCPFGIEVKDMVDVPKPNIFRSFCDLLQQTESYLHARFENRDGPTYPIFMLTYPSLVDVLAVYQAKYPDRYGVIGTDTLRVQEGFQDIYKTAITHYAQRLGIGGLRVVDESDTPYIAIQFNLESGRYWDSRSMTVSKNPVPIPKHRIGSKRTEDMPF